MATEHNSYEHECQKTKTVHKDGASGAVYGLGFIGACVYYFGTATTFWIGVLGFLKALVWPAMLVYEAMKFLSM